MTPSKEAMERQAREFCAWAYGDHNLDWSNEVERKLVTIMSALLSTPQPEPSPGVGQPMHCQAGKGDPPMECSWPDCKSYCDPPPQDAAVTEGDREWALAWKQRHFDDGECADDDPAVADLAQARASIRAEAIEQTMTHLENIGDSVLKIGSQSLNQTSLNPYFNKEFPHNKRNLALLKMRLRWKAIFAAIRKGGVG